MSENEQAALNQFVASEVMFEAVRKVILAALFQNGTMEKDKPFNPTYNWALALASNRLDYTDEELGQDLRAVYNGLSALQQAFDALKLYKPAQRSEEPDMNTAR